MVVRWTRHRLKIDVAHVREREAKRPDSLHEPGIPHRDWRKIGALQILALAPGRYAERGHAQCEW